jgi:hypothetical protein
VPRITHSERALQRNKPVLVVLADLAQLVAQRLQLGAVAVYGHHARAVLQELVNGAAADSAGGANDDDNLAAEVLLPARQTRRD